jgi:hypothetical protein
MWPVRFFVTRFFLWHFGAWESAELCALPRADAPLYASRLRRRPLPRISQSVSYTPALGGNVKLVLPGIWPNGKALQYF